MVDVFISYAREDRARVEDLVRTLEAEGLEVWWDRSIHAGEVFDEAIQEALTAARCVVVVWSRYSVGSRWVRTEAAEGADRAILVPVMIDQVSIPLAFRRLQTVDLIGHDLSPPSAQMADVIAAIRRILVQTRVESEDQGIGPSRLDGTRDHVRGGRGANRKVILLWGAMLLVLALVLLYQSCQIGDTVVTVPPGPRQSSKLFFSGGSHARIHDWKDRQSRHGFDVSGGNHLDPPPRRRRAGRRHGDGRKEGPYDSHRQ